MRPIHTVGLLGLGKMGAPMAGHLIRKGFKVVGFDPTPAAGDHAKTLGVHMVPSPAEVARQSDLVLVVVGFDSEVEDAIWGPEGVMQGAAPGLIVALGSTVSPSYAQTLGFQLLQKHITLLDIPLTRGEAAAISGKMLILGAGEPQAFEACRPVFDTFASDIFHLGDTAGAGQVGKMVNNLILWACTAANDEGLRLGESMGVDPAKMRKALHHSSAQNWAMDERADLSGMPWAEKDMNIVLHEADQVRISLPLCGTIKEVIKGLKIRMGLGIPQVVPKSVTSGST
ncbi:MAG: NAD(P)-dependent oxidoreductase [Betaproteobacteria bacterium]|nr:NAD(P)-dependent oxidoreductase [Betaproteobacteria bacterium]